MRLRVTRGTPDRLKTLHPGYFALVMATGIVAIAGQEHGIPGLPMLLLCLNVIFFLALITLYVLRLHRYPRQFCSDMCNHARGVGFFTFIAATAVLGNQLVLQLGRPDLGFVLWLLACVAWFFIIYGLLTLLTIRRHKPGIEKGLNGGWLLIVVATQALSINTILILDNAWLTAHHEAFMFAALVLWLGGGALYTWVMTLVFFRYTFARMSAADLTPPYWINMGAVAISTLAGCILLEHADLSVLASRLDTFIIGATITFWAIGSWWIPMLLFLGIWRYLVRAVPFAYDSQYWGGVFPLGMYSVCTHHLAQMTGVGFLMPVSTVFLVLAIVAWVLTLTGLITSRLPALLR